MAEDNFKNILFGLILFSLFGMLILTAVVQVGNDYGMNTTEIAGGSMSLQKFNASISSVESNAQAMNERFSKGTVWSALAGVVVEGIFGIAIDIFKMMLLPFGLVQDIMIDVFGVPAFVTDVIMALFIFSIMFAIWRLIKIGD
jgi:hypothetical protein